MHRLLIFLFLLSGICPAQTTSVALTYGSTGLIAIQYNGFQYLQKGAFGVNAVNFTQNGKIIPGSTAATATYNTAQQQTTLTLNWGTIVITYAAAGNRVNVNVTTTNTSAQTLEGVFYEPFDLIFPSAPQQFDGVDPILNLNIGSPTVLQMTAGANSLVLANNDVVRPLICGFPWSLNGPTNTIFPVRLETSQDSMLPNSLPFVNRPIAPGASDTYSISLRFGPASATTPTLASDVYQAFATAFPFAEHWTDRRPIGQLVIAATNTGYPTNPRGWFNDPTVDVLSPQGVAAFQSRLLSWAQSSVAILQSMNAQGMVTWDIEGEQYPQPTTYLCDPTQWETFAPEMNGVIDQYFQTFSNAGLRVGVCIRPQNLVTPPGGTPTQETALDPTQILLSKISYAYKRWGATLFYIDSNGDPNWPISASFFQTVARQFPNVLLIPENQNDQYYSFSAPYDQLSQNVPATPQSVLDIYPSAFSVIYVPNGNFSQYQSQLQAGVNRGDILMFRGWFADSINSQILTLYPPNGVAPPAPVIATPSSGSTVAGTVDLSSSVNGPDGVSSLQYVLDGAPLGNSLSTSPYSYDLATSTLTPGLHNLQALAADPTGDLGFTATNFFVSTDSPGPAVTITAPLIDAIVTGNVSVTATISDSSDIVSAQLSVDGAPIGSTERSAPFQFTWNTNTVVIGPHTLTVTATDSAGQTGSGNLVVFSGYGGKAKGSADGSR